ncbi:MAG: hypothetical protein ACRDXB_08965 [Actinomycetes bacterium]
MSYVRFPGGWWVFEGDDPPGYVFMSSDAGGDPDTVRGPSARGRRRP